MKGHIGEIWNRGDTLKIFGYEIAKAKAAKPTNPVGVVGLKAANGMVSEEFIRALRWPQAAKTYYEMASNDAVIGGCLYLIETIMGTATWKVKAGANDTETALFIEQCMGDMETSWNDFVNEALSMLTYGFSFHELQYKVRRGPLEKDKKFKSKYSDGKIGWRSMPVRSQASFSEWEFDKATGDTINFIQDTEQGKFTIPIEGNLLFKTKAARNNPEGWSLLRRAYRSWYFKKYIEELEGIGVERNLAGIPVLRPDEQTPLFDENQPDMVKLMEWAQGLVNNLRQDKNHGVILPFGWELDLLGSKGDKSMNTGAIIGRHDSRMAACMLADLIMMGGDRTGSFALAETKEGLFLSSLKAIAGRIADVINTQAIPTLLAINNITPEEFPTVEVANLHVPTINELSLMLRAMNIDITKNKELFNFFLNAINAKEITDEAAIALLSSAKQAAPGTDPNATDPTRTQDQNDNQFKQSDQSYT